MTTGKRGQVEATDVFIVATKRTMDRGQKSTAKRHVLGNANPTTHRVVIDYGNDIPAIQKGIFRRSSALE